MKIADDHRKSQLRSEAKRRIARGEGGTMIGLKIVGTALCVLACAVTNIGGGAEKKIGEVQNQVDCCPQYGKLPMYFEPNEGQTDPRVKFLSRGHGYTLFLTTSDAVLVLRKSNQIKDQKTRKSTRTVLRMSLIGATSQPYMRGLVELPAKVNYFNSNDPGKWHTDVPTYAKVQYRNIYPGIDLTYYGNQRRLEFDLVVHPGADPKRILLGFRGAQELRVDARGDLLLNTAVGTIRQQKPMVYQEIDGVRREIPTRYVLKNANQIAFEVAAYDARKPLVIDPTLFYSTYFGGSAFDVGQGIAVDTAGNAYLTGTTGSPDFPTTSGTFQSTLETTANGSGDAFVAKLDPTGSALVYSTYLGSGTEFGFGIAVDAAGNAYVTGQTSSTNFPTTPGAFQINLAGITNAFVSKLNPTGSALVYSTYLGGSEVDIGTGISIDPAGDAYVIGETGSTDFPITSGALQSTYGGGVDDAFVTKLNSTGTGPLIYSTYLGGSDEDVGSGIANDLAGNVYVTGFTQSTDFPITTGSFQTASRGSRDAFVTKLSPNGTAVYSTYVGGTGDDEGAGIAVDSADNAYVTGATTSTDFPTTFGAFQTTLNGVQNAFIAKLSPAGTALVYSTYLGGTSDDSGAGIAVDSAGHSYVTGQATSTDFPTTSGAFQTALGGSVDVFVTALNAAGSAPLIYSTYLGGSGQDVGAGIALDSLPIPNVYISGFTRSTDFPKTSGAFQTVLGGVRDAFVAKIANIAMLPPAVGKVTGGGTIDLSGGIGNFGFIVQRDEGDASIQGSLQYENHVSGAKIHSVTFASFTISGNTATFGGACTSNGVPCTFNVTVQDNDQPNGLDSFSISINNGVAEGGALRGGNVEIHQ